MPDPSYSPAPAPQSSPPPQTPAPSPPPPFPPAIDVLKAASHPIRLAILRELAAGPPLAVQELARRIGTTQSQITKLVRVLDRRRIVLHGRNVEGDARQELYWVPAHCRASAPDGTTLLDFGEVLLRFPARAE